MKKKQQKTQLALISIGLLLILLTYFYYPYMNKDKLLKNQPVREDLENTTDNAQITTFESVEYEGLYNLDKPFSVKSESAYILDEDPDLVFMKTMTVNIYLDDGRIVRIISDLGRYHKESHDCWFEKNVVVNDGETKIFAENLDLLATEKFVKVYNKVRLNNPTGSLQADQIDYDFETKYLKVSMFDDKVVKMKLTE
jgi:LPS export ABC transporter protein LptC